MNICTSIRVFLWSSSQEMINAVWPVIILDRHWMCVIHWLMDDLLRLLREAIDF